MKISHLLPKRHWACVLGIFSLSSLLLSCDETNTQWDTLPTCNLPDTIPLFPSENVAPTNLFSIQTIGNNEDVGTECLIVEDIDRDGWLDIVVGKRNHVIIKGGYLNAYWGLGEGNFEKTVIPMPEKMSPTAGCITSDIDENGTLDLLIGTLEGEVALLSGKGNRSFEPLENRITYPDDYIYQQVLTVVHMDLDGTGPADLLIGTHGLMFEKCTPVPDPGGGADILWDGERILGANIECLLATEDGRYQPAPPGVCPDDLSEKSMGPIWAAGLADLNHDRRPDVIIANDFAENFVLLSHGKSKMVEVTNLTGTLLENHAMGLAFDDFNGDGLVDFYVSDFGPDQLWLGEGCGKFRDGSFETDVGPITDRGSGWGTISKDFDHDGDIDIFVSNSYTVPDGGWTNGVACGEVATPSLQSHYLLLNDGKGVFSKIDIPHLESIHNPSTKSIVTASGDIEGDGDVDIIVAESGRLRIFWNLMPKGGNWINIQPQNELGLPAFGTRITLKKESSLNIWKDVYGGHGTDGHSALNAHFGLGDEAGPFEILIQWADGSTSEFKDISANQHVVIRRNSAHPDANIE
jgi:hypothetical protein